jgi:heptosyltransferase-2
MKPRILVIRGGAIGDFILTLPAIRLLREAFPQAHLEILGYRHIVALAEGRGYADGARSIEYGAMAAFFVPGADLAPDLVEYFASFQQVVSFLYDPSGFFEMNLRRAGVKNFLPAFVRFDDSAHAAQQLARPLESLALYLESHAAVVQPSADDRARAQALAAHPGPLIALHPGSGSARKNWPVAQWIALAAVLRASRPEARLVVVGGEADHAQIAAMSAAHPDAVIARDLPLPVLAALLERAALYLGHDTGISHLAAAVGTPCVLLFGPTDPAIWAPANPGVEVIVAPEGDLARLDHDAVLTVVEAHKQPAPGNRKRA